MTLRHRAGFTLLEMMIVLAILGLAGGLILARGPMRSATLTTRAAAGEIAQALRLARSDAVLGNHVARFDLDVARHLYAVAGGRARALPPEIALSLLTASGQAGGGAGRILFAPDGSSSGGRIVLRDGGVQMVVGVDWLTGRTTVAAHP